MRGEGTQLLAFSPALAPTPPDYPAGAILVGALTPSPRLRRSFGEAGLPAELEAWLGAGPPPVFLGFGSMPVLDAERLVETARASLAAGVPTLVCSVFADQPYWGGLCRTLGVGMTFPFKRLDERRLTAGLRTVLDERRRLLDQPLLGEDERQPGDRRGLCRCHGAADDDLQTQRREDLVQILGGELDLQMQAR
jgi:UDP:flavonoid glycosyltransferase YjiC (YdhE family)